MGIVLLGRAINRIQIIDDDPRVREAYEYSVEELNVSPVLADGPLPTIDRFVEHSREVADAAICDFQLRVKNYASFNGAETVALMYRNQFPAVLCTRYEQANIDEMRRHRRYIPVLLRPDELNPESITKGLEACLKEFNNEYPSSRKPWRTLIRVEDVDNDNGFFYVVIPAWDQNQVIRILKKDVPKYIQERLVEASRFHARVNIGANRHQDIYFYEWEPR